MIPPNAVPAAEFTRNFGRYRMLAQKAAIPVTSHGRITGYFLGPDEFEAFEKFRGRRNSFETVERLAEKLRAVATEARLPRV